MRFKIPTLADAVRDPLVHNTYRIERMGESQRKRRSDALKSSTGCILTGPVHFFFPVVDLSPDSLDDFTGICTDRR
jgi:hypothetical protein